MSDKPLFSAGFHDVPFQEMEQSLTELLVKPFSGSRRRELLLDRLVALLKEVGETGLFTEAWIDGSFVTDKEVPNDVDVVLFHKIAYSLSPREIKLYRELKDEDLMMFRYHCDLYVVQHDLPRIRTYWRTFFGSTRDGVPKGIIRIYF